jgi:hypothetical protein
MIKLVPLLVEKIDSALISRYDKIIREALLSLRTAAGTNPKSQQLIINIARDLKQLTAMIKRDIKKK